MKEWVPKEVEYFSRKYKTAESGNYDIYVVFVEKATQMLDYNGLFGFILPNKFFKAEYGKNLRQLISSNKYLQEIVNFGDQQVFEQVTTYTNLLFLSKSEKQTFKYAEIRKIENPSNQLVLIKKNNQYANGTLQVDILPIDRVSEHPWQFSFGDESKLLDKMSLVKPVLSDVCDKIFQGIITGADKVFVLELNGGVEKEVVELYSKALERNVKIERRLLRPLLKGSLDIRRYRIVSPKKYVIFPYYVDGAIASLIPFHELERRYPNCASYLKLTKKTLEEREHGKWKCPKWHAYSRNQNLVQCSKKKILTPSIAKKAAFVYDENGSYYFLGSGGGGGGGYGLSINKKWVIDPFYLVGLLNSNLLDYLTKKVSTRFRGGFFAYNKQYIQSLPIILPTDVSQKALIDQIAALSSKIMKLNQTTSTISDSSHIELLLREAKVYEENIDELVYELYGVTTEERQFIENEN